MVKLFPSIVLAKVPLLLCQFRGGAHFYLDILILWCTGNTFGPVTQPIYRVKQQGGGTVK